MFIESSPLAELFDVLFFERLSPPLSPGSDTPSNAVAEDSRIIFPPSCAAALSLSEASSLSSIALSNFPII